MSSRQPIGILDSGFGGLSVTRALRKTLPSEDFVFAADCGFAPWGERTDAYILRRVDVVVRFLESFRIKALVLACNTATAVAVRILRERLPIPVVGIEPAVFPALRETHTGVVGVLATPKTIASLKYKTLCRRALDWARNERRMDASILDAPAPGLMQCVERGDFTSEETRRLVRAFVSPLVDAAADRIVLGCTHYPFLTEAIAEAAGTGVALIDPAPAVARQLEHRLADLDLLSNEGGRGQEIFFATDASARREAVLRTLWRPGAKLGELR